MDRKALAECVLDAVADAGYGEFDGIIPATAEALGQEGLEHLKRITDEWAAAPPSEHEWERYRRFGLSSPEDSVRRSKQSTRSIILADVADAQGDVDAYMARYSAEQLTYGTIAPDVARRLLDAGRVDEAFEIVNGARAAEEGKSLRLFRYDLDEVYEECLEKLGKVDELKRHLWDTFAQTLSERSLRNFLKLLPDFGGVEAEEKALDRCFAEVDRSDKVIESALCEDRLNKRIQLAWSIPAEPKLASQHGDATAALYGFFDRSLSYATWDI